MAATRRPARGNAQPQSVSAATATAFSLLGVALAPVAWWFGGPGALLIWLCTAASAWTVTPVQFTGGVRIDALKQVRRAPRRTIAVAVLGAATASVAVGWTVGLFLPPPPLPSIAEKAWYVIGGLAGAASVVARWWVKASLGDWRTVVAARLEWAPRWQMLKHDPAPTLIARDRIGNATVDTFIAPGHAGAMTFWLLGAKILPTIGAGQRLAVLSVPNIDSQGQPQPGTRHPLNFQVVRWDADATPDLASLDVDRAEAKLFIQCAMVWATDAGSYARPILDEAIQLASSPSGPTDNVTPDEDAVPAVPATSTRQAWLTTWHLPDGPPIRYLRRPLREDIAAQAGQPVIVDHRLNGRGAVFIGALLDGSCVFDPGTGVTEESLRQLDTEDVWVDRWQGVLKQDVNPPTIEHSTYAEAQLVDGTVVHRQAFVTLNGVDPMDFFGQEAKIANTLGAAPYVAVAGWPSQASRSGERHPQAFTVYWSTSPVPSNPDRLAPPAGFGGEGRPGRATSVNLDAQRWALIGRTSQAFKAARLAQPEVYDVAPLTTGRGKHIWKISLRLYGGVTLADVRGASQRLRQAIGSEWLRVEAAPDGCILVVGTSPAHVTLADPDRDTRYVASLDWEQAFIDAKVVGVGGLTPRLLQVGHLPANQQVQVLDFELPSGLTMGDLRAATKKLETTTANAFVEVRLDPDGRADRCRVLACEVNPLPERTGFNFDAVDELDAIPFATGVEGEPVVFDPKSSPHALLAGVTGAGKSVLAQAYLYGFAVKGADVYVIDPVKGGADFQFVKPYARAFADDAFGAAGVMKTVYAEVARRKALNAQHGVGSYLELPEPPPPIVVLIDEFTSLMGQSPVPKPSDDPQLEFERAVIIAENQARAEIGIYAGKMAREARSAGVTLLLGTQKLAAKMLDTIPGASDLKDLTLDTRLPVPVSERFSDGWAAAGELVEGDLLYAPDGSTTSILGFTEVFTNNDIYEVTFDDGHVVKAGADHGWLVSSERTRHEHSRKTYGRKDDGRPRAERIAEHERIRDTASIIPTDLYGTAEHLSRLFEWRDEAAVVRFAAERGLSPFQHSPLTGAIEPQKASARRGSPARIWLVDDAIDALSVTRDVTTLGAHRGQWLAARDIAETILGHAVTPTRAGNFATQLKAAGCASKQPENEPTLYNATELAVAVLDHLKHRLGTDPRTGEILGLEFVTTTAEMAKQVKVCRGTQSNWAVRTTAPVAAPDTDVNVDPYVLGAWLCDGSRSSAIFTSAGVASCTDRDGLTDQAHLIGQIQAAGYGAHPLKCGDQMVGTTGLLVDLRAAGVLNDKHIPADYLRGSLQQRLALLQGFMDTDGSVMVSGTCSLPQVNERLAMQARELIESLGIKVGYSTWNACYLPEGAAEKKTTGTVHHLSFSTDLPVFRLPRKLAKQGAPKADGRTTRRTSPASRRSSRSRPAASRSTTRATCSSWRASSRPTTQTWRARCSARRPRATEPPRCAHSTPPRHWRETSRRVAGCGSR
ncbi:FtsK/SpoIIIE domain-containing protein [Nocardioides sp. InS609-2]|uniref:FtsK/SpoIIIE domain-containing protein n=1 Tax=Nocardioides sp. InS609-2 TaxID=2760705 RepID=UPI0020C01E2E|nr:FtsK/SpoIIIE domain-containing protein [Nocardioides sp. InS609-2]